MSELHTEQHRQFIRDLAGLCLSVREYNALARYAFRSPEHFRRIFYDDNQPLSFHEWALRARVRKDALLQVPNFGRKALSSLLAAIDDYLAGKSPGRGTSLNKTDQRRKMIYERHKAGESYASIGKSLGISAARVNQLESAWRRHVAKEKERQDAREALLAAQRQKYGYA